MKKSKFSDSQVMEALKRVEAGLSVPELCRELGISSATFYKWRAKYGGMDTSMIARMKELELENFHVGRLNNENAIVLSAEHHPLHDKPCGVRLLCGVTKTLIARVSKLPAFLRQRRVRAGSHESAC